MVTTTSITTVSVSMRNAQSATMLPEAMKVATCTVRGPASEKPTVISAIQDRTAATIRKPEVMYSLAAAPIERPPKPAISAPRSGRKTMA